VEVDWDSDDLFDGSNEGNVLVDMSIERGRKYTIDVNGRGFEEEETGKFSATFLDADRRFDPYNTDSPLFGKLVGGKLFRCRVRTPGEARHGLMAGVLNEPASYTERGMRMAKFSGNDGWAFLRNQANSVTIPLQESIYADDAMQLVLAAANWPRVWGATLDAGVDAWPYFWVDARSPARVMHELAQNELGTVNMAADGKLVFRSRNYANTEALTLTSDDILVNGIKRMTPSEVIRNLVEVRSSPRTEETTQEVWRMSGSLLVQAGETVDDVWAEFKYNDEVVPVKSLLTPVASTDYLGNSVSDGSGADLTADISMTMTAFATGAQLTITNSGASDAYIWLLKLRGNPLAQTTTSTFKYRDATSVRQFGPLPFVMETEQNVNMAKQYRDLLGLYLSQARNYLVVNLMPNPEVQFAVDLGQVIRVTVTGINQLFRVMRISHKFDDPAGIVVQTQWYLEPFVNLATGVQIPVQIPFQLGSL
jgi:hypothetical protein